MNIRRWILIYLATGPSFTRWAILAFYGGGLVVLALAVLAVACVAASTVSRLFGYPSPAETAGSAVGGQISQLGADVTRRNLNIQPTIKVPVGYRFNVRVNRDMLFELPYRPNAG
jgi:hypothetical protein